MRPARHSQVRVTEKLPNGVFRRMRPPRSFSSWSAWNEVIPHCEDAAANESIRPIEPGLVLNRDLLETYPSLFLQVQHDRFNGVPTGIRTPVTSVKGMCPRPLDDGDAGQKIERPKTQKKSGGARRDRTADLLHAMQALSQLSYGPYS